MQPLRNARLIARLVLVWFALSLGVAMASPLVQPKSLTLVCSGAGVVKFIAQDDDAATGPLSHTLDCSLCLPMSAPPPVAAQAAQPPHALSHALVPAEAARLAARIGAPWQARAPPALS